VRLRLLLDTHVFLWWLADRPKLSQEAGSAVAESENTVYLSVASIWEMVIKSALGKLDAPSDIPEALAANRITPLPIDMSHAVAVASLPLLHNDPFDRMLVAQAQVEGLTLVTRDRRLLEYGVACLLA